MEQVAIIYPALAMFVLTACMIAALGISRFVAIRKRLVSVKYYKLYNEGRQPDWLHKLGRHVQLHFEVPPIFYVGVIFLYITESVTPLAVQFAWAFFIIRCVHSAIHLGPNNVSYRFFCFGGSLLAMLGMWGCLFAALLG